MVWQKGNARRTVGAIYNPTKPALFLWLVGGFHQKGGACHSNVRKSRSMPGFSLGRSSHFNLVLQYVLVTLCRWTASSPVAASFCFVYNCPSGVALDRMEWIYSATWQKQSKSARKTSNRSTGKRDEATYKNTVWTFCALQTTKLHYTAFTYYEDMFWIYFQRLFIPPI